MQTNLQKNFSFSKRLWAFIKQRGFKSLNEFSLSLGYKHSEKINRLFRKENNKPSYAILCDISKRFPELNMNWLLNGQGSMLLQKEVLIARDAISSKKPLSSPELASTDYIPLYDILATAGNNLKFWEGEENILDLIPRKFGMRDCDLAIYVYGDSMCPLYMPGDIALLKEINNYELISYGQVYVVVTAEHRLMKYIMQAEKPDHLRLKSENSHYEDIIVKKELILKIYQVQGFFRKTGI